MSKTAWRDHDERSVVFCPALAESNSLRHGFFTRQGGVSKAPCTSLNCGFGAKKDDPSRIAQNRAFVAGTLGTRASHLVSAYQIHSTEVVIVNEPWRREDAPKADALVTKSPGLAIGVLTADCVPLLLTDPKARVIGAAHAGWRGALGGILGETVATMEVEGAKANQIQLAIGPAIGTKAYEVGADYRENFLVNSAIPCEDLFFPGLSADKFTFDLKGYISRQAEGLNLAAIDDLDLCTYDEEERFFSYRRANHRGEADYGRQMSAIMIKP